MSRCSWWGPWVAPGTCGGSWGCVARCAFGGVVGLTSGLVAPVCLRSGWTFVGMEAGRSMPVGMVEGWLGRSCSAATWGRAWACPGSAVGPLGSPVGAAVFCGAVGGACVTVWGPKSDGGEVAHGPCGAAGGCQPSPWSAARILALASGERGPSSGGRGGCGPTWVPVPWAPPGGRVGLGSVRALVASGSLVAGGAVAGSAGVGLRMCVVGVGGGVVAACCVAVVGVCFGCWGIGAVGADGALCSSRSVTSWWGGLVGSGASAGAGGRFCPGWGGSAAACGFVRRRSTG